MHWMFLILALVAALVELHSGTFYLAALSLVALVTFALGFVLHEDLLILTFLVLSAAGLTAVWIWRRRIRGRDRVGDLDLGQMVLIGAPPGPDGMFAVRYRGTEWMAIMAQGDAPPPGMVARIVGRDGNVLHLAQVELVPAELGAAEKGDG